MCLWHSKNKQPIILVQTQGFLKAIFTWTVLALYENTCECLINQPDYVEIEKS